MIKRDWTDRTNCVRVEIREYYHERPDGSGSTVTYYVASHPALEGGYIEGDNVDDAYNKACDIVGRNDLFKDVEDCR